MNTYMTKTELKERGWTDSMITRLLGLPDLKKQNPRYKRAAPMCLYDTQRVWGCEDSESFKQMQEKRNKIKYASKKAINTKTEKALQFAKTVEIHVPIMDYEEVVKRACDAYNDYHHYLFVSRRHEYTEADPFVSDPDFLARITTNYLRHECTCYDRQLRHLYGKTGLQKAHDILQKRVNEEILKVYTQLK